MASIAFVTYQGKPHIQPDDQRVAQLLEAAGHPVVGIPWDQPGVDWAAFDAVVLRSCWDYHRRPDEFRAWIEMLQTQKVRLMNSVRTVLWNMDKSYLHQLSDLGIAIVPTVWATAEHMPSLAQVMAERGWTQSVLKPVYGASADGIRIISADQARSAQADLETMVRTCPVMIQPLMPQIREGEISLLYFNEQFCTAIRKRPAPDSIFVNRGEVAFDSIDVSAEVRETVQKLLSVAHACMGSDVLVYARVDGLLVDGAFVLMELELIEPSLYLNIAGDGAVHQFAEVLKAVVAQ